MHQHLLCLAVPMFPKLSSTGMLSWKNYRARGVLFLMAVLLCVQLGTRRGRSVEGVRGSEDRLGVRKVLV